MSTQTDTRRGRSGDAADIADDMKHRLKDRAHELLETGKEKLDDVKSRVSDHVREKPVVSLLAAGGIGLLLGLLIARRR